MRIDCHRKTDGNFYGNVILNQIDFILQTKKMPDILLKTTANKDFQSGSYVRQLEFLFLCNFIWNASNSKIAYCTSISMKSGQQ